MSDNGRSSGPWESVTNARKQVSLILSHPHWNFLSKIFVFGENQSLEYKNANEADTWSKNRDFPNE